MAVPAHQDPAASWNRSAYGRQNTAAAAVYKVIRPVRTVYTGRPFHGSFQYSFRMVEIIKSVNLRYIHCKGIRESHASGPFMAGHVEWVHIGFPIPYQAVDQQVFPLHSPLHFPLRFLLRFLFHFHAFNLLLGARRIRLSDISL